MPKGASRASGAAQRPRGKRLRIAVTDARGRPHGTGGLGAWIATVAPARARGDVTIALVSDRYLQGLNRLYRGVDDATDVLSFPADSPARQDAPRTGRRNRAVPSTDGQNGGWLGDIVIATGVARRQARRAGHSLNTELRVLALHGLLHLLGYDHETDDGRMARVERRLRRLGGLRAGLVERSGT